MKAKYFIAVMAMITFGSMNCTTVESNSSPMENENNQVQTDSPHSNKRILARGCDPHLSLEFAKVAPSLLGGVEYIPTTTDEEFFEKLRNQEWSLVYFAPGACRYSAAKQRIPGSNEETKSWTLKEYKELILELQGNEIQIVETPQESEAIALLNAALERSREVK